MSQLIREVQCGLRSLAANGWAAWPLLEGYLQAGGGERQGALPNDLFELAQKLRRLTSTGRICLVQASSDDFYFPLLGALFFSADGFLPGLVLSETVTPHTFTLTYLFGDLSPLGIRLYFSSSRAPRLYSRPHFEAGDLFFTRLRKGSQNCRSLSAHLISSFIQFYGRKGICSFGRLRNIAKVVFQNIPPNISETHRIRVAVWGYRQDTELIDFLLQCGLHVTAIEKLSVEVDLQRVPDHVTIPSLSPDELLSRFPKYRGRLQIIDSREIEEMAPCHVHFAVSPDSELVRFASMVIDRSAPSQFVFQSPRYGAGEIVLEQMDREFASPFGSEWRLTGPLFHTNFENGKSVIRVISLGPA